MKKIRTAHERTRKPVRHRARAGDSNGAHNVSLLRHPRNDLEAAIQRYVDLYDFAPIAYVSFDRAGRIEEANLAATELLGSPRDLLIGRPFALYVADSDSFLRHLLYCRTSEQRVETELLLKSRKGEPIPAQLSSTPITLTSKDGARLYQTAVIDLRERRRAEQALRESQQRLQATYERAPIGIVESSPDGEYVGVNEEFCRFLGYSKDELIQRNIKDVTHKDDYPRDIKLHRQLIAGEIPSYEIEKRYIRKDRAIVWAEMLRSIVRDANGKPLYTIGTVHDITQHKKAEAALQKSKDLLGRLVRERTKALRIANAELKNEIEHRKGLEGEILSISDREQQRLGQELHDGICQHLTAVAFMARSVALRLKNHRVIEVSDIEKIAELVNDAATDTRNLSRALHRIDIDAAGLVDALRDLADREIWRIPCRLEFKPSFHIQNDVAAGELYRIAREAVINANKHSQAREIVIKLERLPRGMVLRVTDDGVGCSNGPKLAPGLGFHIMNYRAQLMGGRLEIDSPKRGGTRVSCYLPNKALQSRKKENARSGLPGKIANALAALI